jgi:hypothetical protein
MQQYEYHSPKFNSKMSSRSKPKHADHASSWQGSGSSGQGSVVVQQTNFSRYSDSQAQSAWTDSVDGRGSGSGDYHNGSSAKMRVVKSSRRTRERERDDQKSSANHFMGFRIQDLD